MFCDCCVQKYVVCEVSCLNGLAVASHELRIRFRSLIFLYCRVESEAYAIASLLRALLEKNASKGRTRAYDCADEAGNETYVFSSTLAIFMAYKQH